MTCLCGMSHEILWKEETCRDKYWLTSFLFRSCSVTAIVTSTFASFTSISLRPWPGGQDSGKLQWTCEECKEEGFLEMVQKTDQELSSKGYKTIAPCLNCLLRVMRWGSDCVARCQTTWNA